MKVTGISIDEQFTADVSIEDAGLTAALNGYLKTHIPSSTGDNIASLHAIVNGQRSDAAIEAVAHFKAGWRIMVNVQNPSKEGMHTYVIASHVGDSWMGDGYVIAKPDDHDFAWEQFAEGSFRRID